MDIKLNINGLSIIRGQIKAENIDVGFSATEGETLNSNEWVLELLDNPAVKRLVEKFANEVSFKPAQPQQKTAANNDVDGKLNALRNQMTAEQKATKKVIHDLMANQERIITLLGKRFE